MVLLSVEGLTKNFGALGILNGVSFEVERSSLHSMVGPNGAGKTTLFNCISGILKPTRGKITFKGAELSQLPAEKRVKLGICRSLRIHVAGGVTARNTDDEGEELCGLKEGWH